MSNSAPKPETTARATMAIPRATFDRVPSKRATYVLAYVIYTVCVFGPNLLALFGIGVPAGIVYAGFGIGIVAFGVFAFHFYTTLRIMGYEGWFSVAMTLVSVPLIPGFFFVAFIDRRLATAWDAADPSGGYRQRPPIESNK